jgi:hemerythrin-like domain-containing protein
MNRVVARLREDHVNFSKLHNLITQQAELAAIGDQVDLELLTEAVEYLADYPAHHHHPLEDAVCERLKRARPAVSPSVEGLLREHIEISSILARFRQMIADVRNGQEVSCAAFASAAKSFVNAELEHMARENAELFPAALAILGPHDWILLEERVGPIQDPLFGPTAAAHLERLRQRLSEADAEHKTTSPGPLMSGKSKSS